MKTKKVIANTFNMLTLAATKGLAIYATLVAASAFAQTTTINVPNASFESPSASSSPYYVQYPFDDAATVGNWLGYGFGATVQAGGPNAYNVSPTGIVGSQFGDVGPASSGLFQDTAPYDGSGDTNLYWQAGYTYTLTVGFFSRGDSPVAASDELQMKLFYRTSRSGGPNLLGNLHIVGSGVNTSSLTDKTLTVTVSAGDASVGYPIGVWFDEVASSGGGQWGIDNIRLTKAPAVAPLTGGLILTNGDPSPQLTLNAPNVVTALHFGNDTNSYTLQGVNFVNVSGTPNNQYFSTSGGQDIFHPGIPVLGTGGANDVALGNICNSFFFGSDASGGFNYTISGLSPYSTNQIEFIHYIGNFGPRSTVITLNNGSSILSQTNKEVNGQPINTRFSGVVVDGSGSISGRFQGLTDGAWVNALIITSQGQGPIPVYTWTGSQNNIWDINSTTNWSLSISGGPGNPSVWTNGVITRFDDSANATTVSETSVLMPITLTVSNNIKSYSFTGPGVIAGSKLLKQGVGTLTILSNNVFGNGLNGNSEVQNGQLILNGNSSNSIVGQLLVSDVPNTTATFSISNQAILSISDTLYAGSVSGSTGVLVSADNSIINDNGGGLAVGGSGVGYATFQDYAIYNGGAGNLIIGQNTGSQGTLNLFGNPQITANSIYVGSGADGLVNQSGGNVTSVPGAIEIQVGSSSQGIWNQTGGTNSAPGWLSIGHNPSAIGILNVSNNAVFNQTSAGGAIILGEGGTGTLNIGNGGIVNAQSTAYGVLVGWNTTGTGTLNLNAGGVLVAYLLQGGQGSGTLNFNGGTLKAAPGANNNFMSYLSAANVLAGGAVIDTGTNTITIVQTLNDGGGVGGLTKLGSGTLMLNAANTYNGNTIISAGTLGGNGSIAGSLINQSNGTLSPSAGASVLSTMTISGNVTLNSGSFTAMKLNKGGSPTQDEIVSSGTVNYGGTLVVTNMGTSLALNDTFQLFDAANYTGNFSAIIGNAGAGNAFSFNPANGNLTVITGPATNSTNITYSTSGSNLTLNWPTDHIGWRLQVQTNAITVGLKSNWVDVANSTTTNQMTFPIVPANGCVFYRLVY